MSQQEVIERLPAHLRAFVARQDHARSYSAEDHAVWRFTLHQLVKALRDTAHPVYLEGLRRTGIDLERIPDIDDINRHMQTLGWSAVVVDGFIPPAVFMEFQARRVLPIALGMRSLQHILYTPAPDIVHEAAGHAPFLVDVDYAEYLQAFGAVGMKAISTAADHAVYAAIRHLSIVKEDPQASVQQIASAQAALDRALAANDNRSEAALLSRLHWWTVEYGLVGQCDDYKLFGAGLLSSLGECVSCLDDSQVRKHPLSVEAVNTPYDITARQPQLFVAQNCKHLSQVLEVFADGMAYRQGGLRALRKALDSAAVCTARYSSGLQVSGRFVEVQTDALDNPIYLRCEGPTQLAYADHELPGHGIDHHAAGFGSPVGRVKGLSRCLSEYCVDELKALGIEAGKRISLEFLSGISVRGQLLRIWRENGRNILFSLADCRVRGMRGESLFEPVWGVFDMAVGERIDAVWGGTADRSRFDVFPQPSAEHAPCADGREAKRQLDTLYQRIRCIREQATACDSAELARLEQQLKAYPDAWLALLELLQLSTGALAQRLREALRDSASRLGGDTALLITMGLAELAGEGDSAVQGTSAG